MKKVFILLIALALAFSLIGCSKRSDETVFDMIKRSPVAKLELPDMTSGRTYSFVAIFIHKQKESCGKENR